MRILGRLLGTFVLLVPLLVASYVVIGVVAVEGPPLVVAGLGGFTAVLVLAPTLWLLARLWRGRLSGRAAAIIGLWIVTLPLSIALFLGVLIDPESCDEYDFDDCDLGWAYGMGTAALLVMLVPLVAALAVGFAARRSD